MLRLCRPVAVTCFSCGGFGPPVSHTWAFSMIPCRVFFPSPLVSLRPAEYPGLARLVSPHRLLAALHISGGISRLQSSPEAPAQDDEMASRPSGGPDSDQVLVEANGSTRTLILNRPKQLNALSSTMVTALLRCFTAYERDDGVKLVILKGKGRAFCAGGDVAEVVRGINNDNWKYGADFFRTEFSLNYMIATYSKPQVSLLTGIVMGGGAGVSLHGKFRVATDNTIFAMPETALGLFPDIGASYFLSRLPGFYGEYVGLAGARLDGAEMLSCGLATHFVPLNRMSLLEESLKTVDTSDPFAVCRVIDQFAQQPTLKGNSSLNRLEIINKCFSKNTVEEIISALEQEASALSDEWVSATVQTLKKASPTSLKISLKSIREGRTQTVGECLRREYRMVCHVMRGDFSRDFFEGCRAILIDRDRNPKWMPSRLEQVHVDVVEKYFSKVDDPRWEDLNLPDRRSHGRILVPKL